MAKSIDERLTIVLECGFELEVTACSPDKIVALLMLDGEPISILDGGAARAMLDRRARLTAAA